MNKTNEKILSNVIIVDKPKKTTAKKTSSTKTKRVSVEAKTKTSSTKTKKVSENSKPKMPKETTVKTNGKSTAKKSAKSSSKSTVKATVAKKSTSSKSTTKSNATKNITSKKVTPKKFKGIEKTDSSYEPFETKDYNIQGMDISALESRLKTLKKNSSSLSGNTFSINPVIIDAPEKKHQSHTQIENNKTKTKANTNPKTKSKSNIFYNFIIIICVGLIIYSIYNIIIWQKNNDDNTKLIEQVTVDTPIEETQTVKINEDIEIEKKKFDLRELINQNSDTVGWISVPNTEINYPVVQGPDNDYYLKRAFDKSYNAAGWIYADYRNKCDNTDKNLIIYGHNRLNNNMFGTLENVLTDEWLENQSNHYITYSSVNDSQLYEVFSAFICGGDESVEYMQTEFNSDDEYNTYLNNIKSISHYNFNTNVSASDKIITLYTCHGLNNQRLLVCGKLVESTPIETEEKTKKESNSTASSSSSSNNTSKNEISNERAYIPLTTNVSNEETE